MIDGSWRLSDEQENSGNLHQPGKEEPTGPDSSGPNPPPPTAPTDQILLEDELDLQDNLSRTRSETRRTDALFMLLFLVLTIAFAVLAVLGYRLIAGHAKP